MSNHSSSNRNVNDGKRQRKPITFDGQLYVISTEGHYEMRDITNTKGIPQLASNDYEVVEVQQGCLLVRLQRTECQLW
jgi:hypothetical protein